MTEVPASHVLLCHFGLHLDIIGATEEDSVLLGDESTGSGLGHPGGGGVSPPAAAV